MPTFLSGPHNSGAAAGSAGSATANATSTNVILGRVLAVYVKYNDSPPAATTDVTIATAGGTGSAPANTILTITNAATNAWFYPRHTVHDEAAAAITYDGTREVHEAPPIHDTVKVTIAGANAGDNVDVWLLMG